MTEILAIFKALSDPTRLRIILLLLERDLCVCELTYILKMSQSRVSHQLRILRDAGLAEDRRKGKWMIYGIPRDRRSALAPCLALCEAEPGAGSRERLRDLQSLQRCLMEDIRRTRGNSANRRLRRLFPGRHR